MKRKDIIKILVSAVLILTVAATASAKSPDKYEFERKDKAAEQKRFLEKLQEDRKKVELAIENTRLLIDKSRNMPYLPELYLRLAELYIEKSRFVFFIRKNQTGSTSKTLDSLETNTLKTQAIEVYQKILNDFPDYQDRDKIRFFMAHEYRELNRLDEMARQYSLLIRKHPSSPYVPECYLLLGDHYIGQQDIDKALRRYKKVLNYPDSSAIIIARYKLAWGHINKGEHKKAIRMFEESVKANTGEKELDVDTYSRVDIRLESLVDMAFCYPDAYNKNSPAQAVAYFREYAWSRQVYTHVLEKLAYRYYIKKKYTHAVAIYRQLALLQHDVEKLIEYAGNIFECVREIGSFKNADQDMSFIIKAMERQKYSSHIEEKTKKKHLKEFELYARDLVTHLHKKALKKKSAAFYKKASDSYRMYLDFFDESPVYDKMLANYAEALFAAGNYIEAGKQYEKMIALKKTKAEDAPFRFTGKKRKEYMNSAIIAYYNALKNRKELNYYQVAYARDGLKSNGEAYVAKWPKSKEVPDILFNISWILFDACKYDEAIKAFTAFIKDYPQGKAAESAVHLTIEAYLQREDYEGLVEFGRLVASNKRISKKARKEVASIVKASEQKLVSLLTIDAMNDWETGSQEIETIVEKNKTTGLGEQALNALILSSKDKGKLDTVFSAGYKLIKYYPKSKHVPDVLAIMIDTAAGSAQFRVVAKYLEEFAKRKPKHTKTTEFLKQAGQIRLALGQYKQSAENFESYLKRVGKSAPGRSEIIFTIADNYEQIGDYASAQKTLKKNLGSMSRADGVRARSLLATWLSIQNNYKQALKYRKTANKHYKRRTGKKYPEMNEAYSRMQFEAVYGAHDRYMKLKLNGKIDNDLVATKAKMLENLEAGYISIIRNQFPVYVIKACYYAGEINSEFARFLRESPLPDGLSPEQQSQYRTILIEKSREYDRKASEYRATCITQSHKWELCEPELIALYDKNTPTLGAFGGESSSSEISEQFLKDNNLRDLHYALIHKPDDPKLLLQLSDAYYERTDYHQSKLIAQKLFDLDKADKSIRMHAWENIGLADIYTGNDKRAKTAFEKILEINPDSINAKVNLAAILQHYRHTEKAEQLFKSVPEKAGVRKAGSRIHPVAKDMYYAFLKSNK